MTTKRNTRRYQRQARAEDSSAYLIGNGSSNPRRVSRGVCEFNQFWRLFKYWLHGHRRVAGPSLLQKLQTIGCIEFLVFCVHRSDPVVIFYSFLGQPHVCAKLCVSPIFADWDCTCRNPASAMSRASDRAFNHHFLDFGNRLGRVQTFGTGLGAVHDGVAAI